MSAEREPEVDVASHFTHPTDTTARYDSFLRSVAFVADDHETRAARTAYVESELKRHGRFELRQRIGAGTFGVVFEAFDREQQTRVAIKALTHTQPESLLLFKREFRSVVDVVHANVLAPRELFELAGTWFFSMELVDGVPLLAALSEHVRLDRAALIACFLQLARGLTVLHGARVVHRDLKSSNVLLDRHGRVVIVDFGLAQPSALEPAAVDWYSFGALLHEALNSSPLARTPELTALCLQLMAARAFDDYAVVALLEAWLGRELTGRAAISGQRALHVAGRDDYEAASSSYRANRRAYELAHVRHVTCRYELALHDARAHRQHSQLALLRQAHDLSQRGSVLVWLMGPPGSGKSSLLDAFAREQTEGVVLRTRCSEREHIPYAALDPVMDGLCHVLSTAPLELRMRADACDVAALAQRFSVFELLRAPELAPADTPDPVRALTAWLTALAARSSPVVVCIDDLHLGDVASVQLMAAVLERRDTPLLIIATARDVAPDTSPSLSELSRLLPEPSPRVLRVILPERGPSCIATTSSPNTHTHAATHTPKNACAALTNARDGN